MADLLVAVIHAFRMPLFFILAGFFVAALAQRHGLAGMVRNRLRRLGLPFALFWPPLFVACALLGLMFLHRASSRRFLGNVPQDHHTVGASGCCCGWRC